MTRQRAFTIIELLVVIAIIAVLVGILFPAIGAVQRRARRQQNNTKVRGIIQAMITASETRRGFFPGFDGFSYTANGQATTGNSGAGFTPQARFWILLDGNYTVGDQLASPEESILPWTTGTVTPENYCYAMLRLDDDTNAVLNTTDRYRREEWRNEQNALAPIVSDRLYDDGTTTPNPGTPNTYLSIHDGSVEGRWYGSVGFGAGNVEFIEQPTVTTRIAGFSVEEDDIFDDSDAGTGDQNAMMTYQGVNDPVGAAP